MEKHGLVTHIDKMCADSLTENTPNTPQFILPVCPNRPIFWDIFEKGSHHVSIAHGRDRYNQRLTIEKNKEKKTHHMSIVHGTNNWDLETYRYKLENNQYLHCENI